MHFLFPLIGAIAFAFGAMVYKRAYFEGAGVAHALVVNHVILGLVFVPLIVLDPHPVPWGLWWMPVVTATAFVSGHLLNVISLKVGDVSLSTPLLGSKVVFVVLISRFVLGRTLSTAQWSSAGLTALGVFAMGATDFKPGGKAGVTTLLALSCSAAFASTDVMIESWGNRLGVWNFLSLQFAALAAFSMAILPAFGRTALRAPRRAWKWIFLGAALSGVQAILITGSIAIWKDAASVNVIYATRGLWSLVFVWGLGRHMKNTERTTTSAGAKLWRTAGACLILAGVVLAVKSSGHSPVGGGTAR